MADASDPSVGQHSTSVRLLQLVFRRAQHRLAGLLGVDEERRTETVIAMLDNNARRVPGYWIQLFLAAGIASLGLVLGSTAVVIGAMLVSPLMGPILELGMGFAVGSPLLIIRAWLRVLLSVGGVIAGSALLTLLLPYHEITAEIAARTSPTALDLLVAIFCALVAAYTTVRPSSDTAAAAAGTAIGIALVPPLCTVGFGIGTLAPGVAGGAMLLFVANFSAILVFSVGTFVALGFSAVDAAALEERFLTVHHGRATVVASRSQRLLQRAFGSRFGTVFRLAVPALFLLLVYVPLGRALDEVTWEVRTRDAIRHILGDVGSGALQTSVSVDRQSVAVQLLLPGSAEQAASLEHALSTRIAAAAGVLPSVTVTAVADAKALSTAPSAARLREQVTPIAGTRTRVDEAMATLWPSRIAGPVTSWDLVTPSGGEMRLNIRHVGGPIGAPAVARSLDRRPPRRAADAFGDTARAGGAARPQRTSAVARARQPDAR